MNLDFQKDIIDLFSYKKGGHVQKWIYNDHVRPDGFTGSKLWHSFVTSSEEYYLIQNEIDLIPTLTRAIEQNYDTVIDFGLGNERAINNKTIPILLSQHNLSKYVGIDISQEILSWGSSCLIQQFKSLQITEINGDFYKTHSVAGENKLGIFLGSTISNQNMMVDEPFPRENIIKHIKTLGNTTKGDTQGSLILSFDSNPDLDFALDSYQHPSWINMMTGLMHDVYGELKPEGNFNPSMWHYLPQINTESHVIHHSITPSIDQNFSIAGHEFNLKKGDLFVIINCFKYPIDLLIHLLGESGFSTTKPPVQSNEHTLTMIQADL